MPVVNGVHSFVRVRSREVIITEELIVSGRIRTKEVRVEEM